jgi:hypothetical protein
MTMPKTSKKPKQPKAKTKVPTQPKKAPPRPATKAAAKTPADAPKKPTPESKPAKGRKKRDGKKPAAKTTGAGTPKAASEPKTTSKPKAASKPKPKTQGKKPCDTGKCDTGKCTTGKCPVRKQLDGRSLFDRARECTDLEDCRKFIVEFNEAVEQANQWLDDMHAQALSAEEARDVYGAQISDLLEAIDIDRARIAELETELKKARAASPKSAAPDAALAKLAELSRQVQGIRRDLQRLLEGRAPSSERRQRVRAGERASTGRRGRPSKAAAAKGATASAGAGGTVVAPGPVRAAKTTRRRANLAPGAFPKYSVLRGAACSLGVGKYNYPPEVCAPASFSREEAAQIMGTYAQNKYGGLAKWALITGLPIDDVVVPLTPQPATRRKPATARTPTSTRKPPTNPGHQRAASPAKARRSKPSKSSEERSNRQILDQVLLTVARV